MFGLSFLEITLIGLVAIIFIKPAQWPELFQSIGRMYGRFSRLYHNINYHLRQVDSVQHTTPFNKK